MTPRIPLPTDQLTSLGIPDTGSLSPEISKVRGRIYRETNKINSVDPVTTELVRMRNARYQACFL
ncbi:MAG TPA: hypothetical protein VFW24_13490 [Acidimicrobiales bacterium]|jgi:hypothetical protein|nr:hypothetical protein [Acidimicrobiales bacterium]